MIVLDASAAVEWLLNRPLEDAVGQRLWRTGQTRHAPHLLSVEVAQVVRRLVRQGEASSQRGSEAIVDLADLGVERYAHELLLPRMWTLRENLTAYDAVYVALAETLQAPLVTLDARLAEAPGHAAEIDLIR